MHNLYEVRIKKALDLFQFFQEYGQVISGYGELQRRTSLWEVGDLTIHLCQALQLNSSKCKWSGLLGTIFTILILQLLQYIDLGSSHSNIFHV